MTPYVRLLLHVLAFVTCTRVGMAINFKATLLGVFAGVAAVFLGVQIADIAARRKKKTSDLLVALIIAGIAAGATGCVTGQENHHCYDNLTCDTGLICIALGGDSASWCANPATLTVGGLRFSQLQVGGTCPAPEPCPANTCPSPIKCPSPMPCPACLACTSNLPFRRTEQPDLGSMHQMVDLGANASSPRALDAGSDTIGVRGVWR